MEENKFPTKTKIAAWWIKVIGIGIIFLGLGYLVVLMFYAFWHTGPSTLLHPLSILLLGWFICFLSSQVAKQRKWAWWAGILSPLIIWLFYLWYIFLDLWIFRPWNLAHLFKVFFNRDEFFLVILYHIFILPPIFLLILDRKNFFKIAL